MVCHCDLLMFLFFILMLFILHTLTQRDGTQGCAFREKKRVCALILMFFLSPGLPLPKKRQHIRTRFPLHVPSGNIKSIPSTNQLEIDFSCEIVQQRVDLQKIRHFRKSQPQATFCHKSGIQSCILLVVNHKHQFVNTDT